MAPEHHRFARCPTLTVGEITALPVAGQMADPAHCDLWACNALLPRGFRVLAAWGFEYKANIVWHKVPDDRGSDGRGAGFHFRNVTEFILFGTQARDARSLASGPRQVNLSATRKREHSDTSGNRLW